MRYVYVCYIKDGQYCGQRISVSSNPFSIQGMEQIYSYIGNDVVILNMIEIEGYSWFAVMMLTVNISLQLISLYEKNIYL